MPGDANDVSVAWTSERTVRLAPTGAGAGSSLAGAWARALRAEFGPGVLDVVPADRSVTLVVDPARVRGAGVLERAREIVAGVRAPDAADARVVEVPVCYGGRFGPDLEAVAEACGLRPSEVVARHAASVCRVAFFGFSPGFGYLEGLDPALRTPRLDRPRTRVEPSSVGIGGSYTGVYPQAMPGGWRLIGRTPLTMFDAASVRPTPIEVGDVVRFVPIDEGEFERRCGRATP